MKMSSGNNAKNNKFEKYFLGLDIGTDSVGWCVTDTDYNILKFNGKAMWGIRLFDEATPAAERRNFRSQRRRLRRRQQRIKLVEELLNEEICKVDPLFYIRLRESKFREEDKLGNVNTKYSLFADSDYTDVDYYKEFKTIYHLRLALMEHKKKYDIRLYYLAIANFMKHRGHFLFSGNVSDATSFDNVWDSLCNYTSENMEFSLEADDIVKVKELLLDKKIGKIDKKKKLIELFSISSDKEIAELQKTALSALCGSKTSLDKLFNDEELKDAEIKDFSFSDGIDENKEELLSSVLGERFDYILRLKGVYDWVVLTEILSGSESISEAQVKRYAKHEQDLKDLKSVVRKYLKDDYKEIFSACNIDGNYAAYVGQAPSGKVAVEKKKCEPKDFCDYLKKKLNKIAVVDDPVLVRIMQELDNYTFMPKQVSKANSSIPYQVHLQDLDKILDNMITDYPELGKAGDDGLSVKDKIRKTFMFRIPYYVGPLNTYHSDKGGNSWMKRNKEGKIYPWNFDEIVEKKASAEEFIQRLTNKCTYLKGEDVVPKNSLLYSKYMVLNELNNVRANGERLSVEVKQRIYDEFFKKTTRKCSLKKIKLWMIAEGIADDDVVLSGIDDTFKASLQSYNDFYKIIGSRVDTEPGMVDTIIKDITIFGDDKALLKERIRDRYKDKLSDEEISKIAKLSYQGWGNFSVAFLNGIEDANRETGELMTIIKAMWEGNENLMELLDSKHGYADKVREHNSEFSVATELNYDLVKDSYASPAVKRGIWQTLLIIKELKKVTGNNPYRIFVEVARNKEDKPERKLSRKTQLIELYKSIKGEEKEWVEQMLSDINSKDEREFSSKKLFLYYTQMGRDMYSGEPIDLSELFTNKYNIDHIYPRSKTKDDSILNNLVLTKAYDNQDKDNEYPIPEKYRQEALWTKLRKLNGGNGLITKEKYDRLMRREPLTDDELASFISRQLVETRQTTKVVTQILEQTMPDVTIVYSKANIVSDFRKDNGFLKSRSVNDYHHAKDAYLNIVVGNVYYTKFTNSPARYISDVKKAQGKETYSLNRMFDYEVKRNLETAWVPGENGTIKNVQKYMAKNNILFTRYATEKRGGFFDQMPLKKGSGELVPLKMSDSRYDISLYGGYKNPGINYFALVESDGKKGRMRTVEGIPVYLNNADENNIVDFLEDKTGRALKNVTIIIPEIKINSLFRINGYPMHLSSKTNDRISMKNAVELVLSKEQEQIAHYIDKVVEKLKDNKNYKPDEHDNVDNDSLLGLYDVLIDKALNTIYSEKIADQGNHLMKNRQKFEALSIADKCKTISEILHLFQCNATGANLSQVGGGARVGIMTVNNRISDLDTCKLVTQSITGLFEKEIDLLK